MKVVDTGGVPKRPVNAKGPGPVYKEIVKAQVIETHNLSTTSTLFKEKMESVTSYLTYYYDKYTARVNNHLKQRSNVHGDNVESIGLWWVNDYPNATYVELLDGQSNQHYVTPKVIRDALLLKPYTDQPDRISAGLLEINGVINHNPESFKNATLNDHLTNASVSHPVPSFYKDRALVLNSDNRTSACLTDPLTVTHNQRMLKTNFTTLRYQTLGWNNGSVFYDSNGKRRFLITSGKYPDLEVVPETTFTGDQPVLMLPFFEDDHYLLGYVKGTTQGVLIGLSEQQLVNGEMKETLARIEVNGNLSTRQLTLSWPQLGLSGFTVSGTFYGGINWDYPGKRFMVFFMVNGLLDQTPVTLALAWDGTFVNGDRLRLTPLFNVNTVKRSDRVIPRLDDYHPFQPTRHIGVFKPNGGHFSGYTQHGVLGVKEHHHTIRSLRELYQAFPTLPSLPVNTHWNLRGNHKYGLLGSSLSQVYLTGKDRYLITQHNPNGLRKVTLAKASGVLNELTLSDHLNLGSGNFIRPELVNYVDTTQPYLHGLWWSNLNQYEGVGVYHTGYLKAQGNRTPLSEDTKAFLEEMLITHLDINGYVALIQFHPYQSTGVIILSDRTDKVGVINVTLNHLDDEVSIKDYGSYHEFDLLPSEQLVNCSNLLAYTSMDVYIDQSNTVTLRGLRSFTNDVIQFTPNFVPGTTDTVNWVSDKPCTNGLGLLPPIPMSNGKVYCYTQPSATHDNVTYSHPSGETWLPYNVNATTTKGNIVTHYIDPDLTIVLNGRVYDVPPGLHVRSTKPFTHPHIVLRVDRETLKVELREVPSTKDNEINYGNLNNV